MNETKPAENLARQSLTIKVCGLGGAGGNAVSHMAQGGFAGVGFVALNTDAQALAQTGVTERFTLGQRTTRGLGAGGDPEQGRAAAEEDVEQLQALCAGVDILFVVGGLGGGTATGAAPVLARVAREAGALVLGIVTLPFEFEGGRRQRQALLGLQQLKAEADGVICLPNQKIFKLVDQNTSLVETFKITNELLAQAVRGVWRLLAQPGLINLDFADLCAVTRGRHSESSLATAEAAGEQRAREVWNQLAVHPLLEGEHSLAQAEAVIVSLVGGPDMTMADVDRVMEQISRHAEHADIKMGAVIDAAFAGKLSVTLLASHQLTREELAPPAAPPREVAPAGLNFETPSASRTGPARTASSRYVPPPPSLPAERAGKLFRQQGGKRKRGGQSLQGQLPLEIISKGRFERIEPTIMHGEDLDVPTYIRRGVALN